MEAAGVVGRKIMKGEEVPCSHGAHSFQPMSRVSSGHCQELGPIGRIWLQVPPAGQVISEGQAEVGGLSEDWTCSAQPRIGVGGGSLWGQA